MRRPLAGGAASRRTSAPTTAANRDGVRHIVAQDSPQRVLGIEHHEPAPVNRLLDRQPRLASRTAISRQCGGRGNRQELLTASPTVVEELGYRFRQRLGCVEQLDGVTEMPGRRECMLLVSMSHRRSGPTVV